MEKRIDKATERALEAYPKETRDITGFVVDIGHPQYMRDLYIEGYHQAEKDLELTWEDISKIISIDQQVCGTMGISDYTHSHQQAMEEVLKRYKERKEK